MILSRRWGVQFMCRVWTIYAYRGLVSDVHLGDGCDGNTVSNAVIVSDKEQLLFRIGFHAGDGGTIVK